MNVNMNEMHYYECKTVEPSIEGIQYVDDGNGDFFRRNIGQNCEGILHVSDSGRCLRESDIAVAVVSPKIATTLLERFRTAFLALMSALRGDIHLGGRSKSIF